jgi:hypothetical protein
MLSLLHLQLYARNSHCHAQSNVPMSEGPVRVDPENEQT